LWATRHRPCRLRGTGATFNPPVDDLQAQRITASNSTNNFPASPASLRSHGDGNPPKRGPPAKPVTDRSSPGCSGTVHVNLALTLVRAWPVVLAPQTMLVGLENARAYPPWTTRSDL